MARIFVKPLKGGSKGWSEREAMELVRQSLELEALPEGWTRTDAVAVLDVDGRPMAVESLRFPRGATSKIWVRLCGANVVRVEVVTADRTPSTWVAARDRFVRSLRPEAAP